MSILSLTTPLKVVEKMIHNRKADKEGTVARMSNMDTTITKDELLAKGYNMRQAARAIDRSVEHVRLVLSGQRSSRAIMTALCALPKREYKARRPVTEEENCNPKTLFPTKTR